ncbi:hypothetical protein MLD38_036683 [Melastoma candidum]|uniref:Uncharacterized protein n=1 Tax=Melastoma candidum TaxID=119954 RepID=A0ACB9LL05_9MYRT|nr:hypothetical protein MLD38_036683 [Melastoma candidum]
MAADAFPPMSPLPTSSFRKSGRKCCCLASLVTVLKRCRKMVNKRRRSSSSRQTSFKCCYDPLSYALNFDSEGQVSNYEDCRRFCAFKNRSFASPTTASETPALAIVSG